VKQLRDAEEAGITLIPHNNILPNVNNEDGESKNDSKSDDEEKPNIIDEKDDTSSTNEASEANGAIKTNGVIKTNEAFEANGHFVLDDVDKDHNDVNELLSQSDATKSADVAKLSAKVRIGTEFKFSGLEVNENVASILLKNLLLVVQCIRCKKGRTDLTLQSKRKVSSSCKKCNVAQSGIFYPEIVHQYSHVVGYLHLDGCKAFDAVLVDSTFVINCLNCSKDTIKKGIAYGKKGDTWCSFCHTKMEIQIMSSKFTQLQKNGEKLQEVKTVAKKAVKHPGIKEGTPLPDNGTCKHYKKSYRWLRFPCCGKVYSCDICHEEGEENDHEMKFATRMICGYCSKEQPFAKDKPCVSCKHSVTKSKSSHWEGGKGCRNRTTMDRNDNKKTAGLGKTISRKKAAET